MTKWSGEKAHDISIDIPATKIRIHQCNYESCKNHQNGKSRIHYHHNSRHKKGFLKKNDDILF